MAEGFPQSASRQMDNSEPLCETERVPLIELAKCTTTEETDECSPTNLNVFLEKEEKTTQKSLYTKLLEAEGGSSGEGVMTGNTMLSEVARDISAIVSSAAVTVTDEEEEITGPKQCNLAATSAFEGNWDRPKTSSSGISRYSMTETQLEASDLAEDARVAADEGRRVVYVVRQAIQSIEHNKRIAEEKAMAVSGADDEQSEKELAFHLGYVSKFESALTTLHRKIRRLESRMGACERAAETALEVVTRDDEVTDVCHLKTETEAAIIGLLRKEYIALKTVRQIYYKDDQAASECSSERTESRQQCAKKERNLKLGNALGFVVGATLLGMTSLFDPKSESLLPIALIGGVATLWTTVFWLNRLRKWIQRRSAGTEATAAEEPTRRRRLKIDFMEYLERRLRYVDGVLRERGMIPRSDVEESGSSSEETVQVEGACANA